MDKRDHLIGFGFTIFWTAVLCYFGEISFIKASIVSSAAWIVMYLAFYRLAKWAEPAPQESPWAALNLDQNLHRETLGKLFDQYGVKGSANIRDGRIYPVVPPETISPLAKRLRASVALIKMHPRAGADLFYMEDSVVGLADLTVMEIEAAASVMERVEEDRNTSRKLYKGHSDGELLSLARTIVCDWVRNEPSDIPAGEGNALVVAQAVRRGEYDDHPAMRIALKTLRFAIQVKGTAI